MQDINPGLREDARSHVLNYLQLLWFRRRFILLVTLLVALLGVAWLSQQRPVYESTSSLRIGSSASAGPTADDIGSEIAVLRSRAMATAVIQEFQLQVYGEFNPAEEIPAGWPDALVHRIEGWLGSDSHDAASSAGEEDLIPRVIDRFLARLEVERVDDSRVVRISFSSRDPELAARIANAIPRIYMESRLRERIEASESTSNYLTQQYLELKERLAAAERAEAFYRDTFDLTETGRIERYEQELSDLNSRLLIAQARKRDALERLALIESLAGDEPGLGDDVAGLSSPLIVQLAEKKRALAERIAALGDERPPGDAERATLDEELDQANAAIRSELDHLAVSLQQEAAAATQEAIQLEQELARLALESSEQHRRLLQLRELERETAVARLRLEAVTERVKADSLGAGLVTPDSTVISAAVPGQEPMYPGRTARFIYVVLAGLGLALLIVLVLQLRNPGLLSPEHVHFVIGEKTIGVIPAVPGKTAPQDLVIDEPESAFAEAVGALRITLDLADLDHRVGAVQLVSSTPGEGRASLAVALARAEAAVGRKVLLVSAHLRHSTVEKKIGVKDRLPGLTDLLLSDDGTLSQFVEKDTRSDVNFLSAGTAEYANPDVVFSSQRMASVVQQMRREYEFIVIDTPPMMTTADAVAIGKMVDQTLFVVRWNKTPKRLVGGSLRKLREGGIEIAGVVLQHVNLRRYGQIGYSDFGYLYHQKR